MNPAITRDSGKGLKVKFRVSWNNGHADAVPVAVGDQYFEKPFRLQGPPGPLHIRAVRNGFPFDPISERRWFSGSLHSFAGTFNLDIWVYRCRTICVNGFARNHDSCPPRTYFSRSLWQL